MSETNRDANTTLSKFSTCGPEIFANYLLLLQILVLTIDNADGNNQNHIEEGQLEKSPSLIDNGEVSLSNKDEAKEDQTADSTPTFDCIWRELISRRRLPNQHQTPT